MSRADHEAVCEVVGVRDPDGDVQTVKGAPEADTEPRDYGNVPLNEHLAREVLPHVPDAWIDYTKTGYEIPFTRYFYVYEPPRPLSEIQDLLGEVTE
ncbi:type I restriction enzyme M protein [Actinopolyspora mzabensis]|uniref:Type I restriction enzyme M protein n=1 Tax=Actinopolyspora mzabensis TaxID=995066 RepID=A0A1G8ZYG4_ACTMZ|nr:hypothetical protein [Actinopolyspora mzabensis]SDK20113.1 type I restriction enzyme M protein [Actinopolyspora mzabensis]